uniref:Autophagy-related protein 18 n=1 Tax=Attheya septentrionalis TaxID=420275 RepID=A0A7S2UQV0_9STRA|mmetsp:Transcript_8675/g.15719  ORF Transcript_8675/g.15719 Transcript_8675/m.15719 type:complete len:497 (+) Transcript_8675:204-1694(+)
MEEGSSPVSSEQDDQDDVLMSVSFNQDGGCLAVATANGFRICNVSPYQETFRRVLASSAASPAGGGAIGTVAMLFRCNLLCLTGGGAIRSLHTNANFYCPPNKVLIWDDHLGRCIGELSFRQCVLAVKLRRDRIAVALRDRVYVYNFSDLNVLDKIYTSDNPNGLLQISTEVSSSSAGAGSSSGSSANSSGMVLACPSVTPGQVRVELYGMRKTVLIDAHESNLAALALTADGSLLATASEKGTVIRLFDARRQNAPPIQEFRRGVERATVSSLAFHSQAWLACSSDRGTVHVFAITYAGTPTINNNNTTSKSWSKTLSSPGKYLLKKASGGGEGKIYSSVAQVRGVPHPMVCAFVPDSVADSTTPTLAVAGMDELGNGVLLLSELASDGGEPKRVGYHRFFKKSGSAALAAAAQKSKKKPHQHSSASPQELYVQDTATYIAHGFDNIIVREEEDEIGFVSVEKTDPKSAAPSTVPSSPTKSDEPGNVRGQEISAE